MPDLFQGIAKTKRTISNRPGDLFGNMPFPDYDSVEMFVNHQAATTADDSIWQKLKREVETNPWINFKISVPVGTAVGALSGFFAGGPFGAAVGGVIGGTLAGATEIPIGMAQEYAEKMTGREVPGIIAGLAVGVGAGLLTGRIEKPVMAALGVAGRPLVKEIIEEGTKTTTKYGKFVKGWRRFWMPFSTLDNEKQLVFERSTLIGKLDKTDEIIMKYTKELNKFDLETNKNIMLYHMGEVGLDTIPDEAKSIARKTKALAEGTGYRLFKVGAIPEDVYNSLKGKYAHYMYAEDVFGADNIALEFRKSGKLNMEVLLPREKMSFEQRLQKGLVLDASKSFPVGIGKGLYNVAMYDYYHAIDKLGLIWKPSIVDIPEDIAKHFGIPNKIGIDALDDLLKTKIDNVLEAVKEGRVLLTDPAIKRYTVLRSIYNAARESFPAKIPDDYVKMPVNRAWGELSGAYIRKEVAGDLIPLSHMLSGVPEELDTMWKIVESIASKGMAIFKAGKVALNLPTMFRNLISGLLQKNMGGENTLEIIDSYYKSLIAFKTGNKYYHLAKRFGFYKTSFAGSEIEDLLKSIEYAKQHKTIGGLFTFLNKAVGVYSKFDEIQKTSILINRLEKGMDLAEAVYEANKWGMDYSLAARSIKSLRRFALPFVSYQYKIAPLFYEAMTKRPWVIAKFTPILWVMMKYVAQYKFDISDKEWKNLMQQTPEFIRTNRTVLMLPWKSKEGNWQWSDMGYFIPWGNLWAALKDVDQQKWSEIPDKLGVSPFLDLAATWLSASAGKPPTDPFTGRPIFRRIDPPAIQYLKMMEYTLNKWLPTSVTKYGAVADSIDALKGLAGHPQKDRWGREMTPSTAIGKWFGVNIQAPSPVQVALSRKARSDELRRELNSILFNPEYDQKDLTKYIKRYTELIEAINKGEF